MRTRQRRAEILEVDARQLRQPTPQSRKLSGVIGGYKRQLISYQSTDFTHFSVFLPPAELTHLSPPSLSFSSDFAGISLILCSSRLCLAHLAPILSSIAHFLVSLARLSLLLPVSLVLPVFHPSFAAHQARQSDLPVLATWYAHLACARCPFPQSVRPIHPFALSAISPRRPTLPLAVRQWSCTPTSLILGLEFHLCPVSCVAHSISLRFR